MPTIASPLVAVRLGDVAQDGRLRLARRAPGRPEVEPDELAAQVREADRVGRRGRSAVPSTPSSRVDRQLRREVARAEALRRGSRRGTGSRRGARVGPPGPGAMGRVTSVSAIAATTMTAATVTSWRAANGPMPRRGGLGGGARRRAERGPAVPRRPSQHRGEVEVLGQQHEEVEDHRQPDRRDEQAADERDDPSVADEEPHAGRASGRRTRR